MMETMTRPGRADAPLAVSVPVRSPARSARFYSRLLGLRPAGRLADGEGLRLARADRGRGEPEVRLLRTQRPPRLRLALELGSCSEVLDVYLLALLLGARRASLRLEAGLPIASFADPDGHEVVVHAAPWTGAECGPRDRARPGRLHETPRADARGPAGARRRRPTAVRTVRSGSCAEALPSAW